MLVNHRKIQMLHQPFTATHRGTVQRQDGTTFQTSLRADGTAWLAPSGRRYDVVTGDSDDDSGRRLLTMTVGEIG
jgi:hypothetical protein